MIILESIYYCLLVSVFFMSLVFVLAKLLNRYDIIDSAWGAVFIAIASVAYIGQQTIEIGSVQTVVWTLVTIWGLRLCLHIYNRWGSTKEDGRYVELRNKYKKLPGGESLNMFLRVFLVQAILAVIVCLPVIVVMTESSIPFTALMYAGVSLWLVGFLFETLGDAQLANYLKNTKDKHKLMTKGLWRYTRHPNYFGEVTQWWGIFIVALTPLWYVSVIGPIVITLLILFVSGISLTEKRFEGRPGWKQYKEHTSMFLPLPRKS